MEHFKIPEETLNQAIINTQVFAVNTLIWTIKLLNVFVIWLN